MWPITIVDWVFLLTKRICLKYNSDFFDKYSILLDMGKPVGQSLGKAIKSLQF